MKIKILVLLVLISINLFGIYVKNPLYVYLEMSDLVISGKIVKITKSSEITRSNEYSINDEYYVCISTIYKKSKKYSVFKPDISVNDTIKFYCHLDSKFPIFGESGILFLKSEDDELRIIPPLGIEPIESEPILTELCKKNNISKELIIAISNNNINKIKHCVNLGALKIPSIYYFKYFEVTPIIKAIRQNNTEIVKYLIQNGADIKQDTLSGISALSAAVTKNSIESTKLLYKYGANLNVKDKVGNSLLMYISGDSDIKLIKFLLDKGIDINAQNDNGDTFLMLTIQRNNPDTKFIEFLLKNKADPKIKNNVGKNCYDFVDKKNIVLLKLLRKYD